MAMRYKYAVIFSPTRMERTNSMPNMSINTNAGAMVALQNLNKTNTDLQNTQSRINTGLKVANAKDNGSTWAIAQTQRGAVASLGAVRDSLNRASSTIDVAMAASESLSDMLIQMKEKALSASDTSLDTTSRASLNEDFKALRDQITKTVQNASFNGINMIKSGGTDIRALANASGTSVLTVKAENLSLGGGIITVATTTSFTTATQATAAIAVVDASIKAVNSALSRLGTSSKSVEMHATFIGKLSDALENGIGNLVDADLAKESAKLQALQTKQQLGIQALSIANQSPSIVTQLFQ
jgi:flagellin